MRVKIVLGVLLLLFLSSSSGCLQETAAPVACTADAKICPDGTAVGRIAPDCKFAPCPDDSVEPASDTPRPNQFPDTFKAECVDGQIQEALCPDRVTTYLAENCVDGKWATVNYIRNPCEPLPNSEPGRPDDDGRICPAVCVPMWEMKRGQCEFTDCGSGCGPDGKTTFESEAECTDAAAGKSQAESCDAFNPCTKGDCYKFQDESSPICWTSDPCEKCESGECNVAESYPMQVFCR